MAVYNAANDTPKNAGELAKELGFCWKSTKDALVLLEALGAIRRVEIGRRKFFAKNKNRLEEENSILKRNNLRLENKMNQAISHLKEV